MLNSTETLDNWTILKLSSYLASYLCKHYESVPLKMANKKLRLEM